MNLLKKEMCIRDRPTLLPTEERGMDKEDISGITEEEAKRETDRCFNCGCLAVNSSDVANMLLAYDASIKTNLRTLTAQELLGTKTRVSDVLKLSLIHICGNGGRG